jgi:hypothetical protein
MKAPEPTMLPVTRAISMNSPSLFFVVIVFTKKG